MALLARAFGWRAAAGADAAPGTALIDTLGSCDKRALPFSSEPNAALPRFSSFGRTARRAAHPSTSGRGPLASIELVQTFVYRLRVAPPVIRLRPLGGVEEPISALRGDLNRHIVTIAAAVG
jgi:hypothetical protein